MNDQFENQHQAVQLQWISLGFALSASGLVLLALDSMLELGFILSFAPGLRKLLVHPVWAVGLSSCITSTTFIGSYALWRRLPTTSWTRASTLLLIMNSTHVALWLAVHHSQLGLPDQNFEHDWFRLQISQILNWSEFLAWMQLIKIWNQYEFSIHADTNSKSNLMTTTNSPTLSQPYPGYCWLGLIVSVIIAASLTDWKAGWPLMRVGWLMPLDSLMLATVSTMLTLVASMQVCTRCYKAAKATFSLHRQNLMDHEQTGSQWYQDQWTDDPWGQLDKKHFE